jgi:DNA gyrase subunit B
MADNYGQDSISKLKGEQQVRQKPSVIFGRNDEYGCLHGVYEIIANAIDEAREGHGNKIKVTIFEDGSFQVEDDGRGVPMGWNPKENKWNWELVFCDLYASGKYDAVSYGQSLGLNGLGATAMQYASKYMHVESVRNYEASIMDFAEGKPVGQLRTEKSDKEHGTTIRFKPDDTVFTNTGGIVTEADTYIDIFRKQAMLHDGMKFELHHIEDDLHMEIGYPHGITQFVNKVTQRPMIPNDSIYIEGSEEVYNENDPEGFILKTRVALNFTRSMSLFEVYHNGSHLVRGKNTVGAFQNAILSALEQYGKETGKFSRTDKVSFKDVEPILVCVGTTDCQGSKSFFENQTKEEVTNKVFAKSILKLVQYQLYFWLNKNKALADKITEEVKTNKIAREESAKLGRQIIAKLSKGTDSLGSRPKKFIDCKSKDTSLRELYLVEGDSALGSVKLARDADYQAILPVQGKIINCMKHEIPRILSNERIVEIEVTLGCGLEIDSKQYNLNLPAFDMDKLRWSKIIICTDADVDGWQIRCLILAKFYRLNPSLLKAGKVYIAETPLYEISVGQESKFAYSDKERDDLVSILHSNGVSDKKIRIQRSKGLGENTPEMMNLTTMNPSTRRLTAIKYPENQQQLNALFESLLGNDLDSRKEYIQDYFDDFNAQIGEVLGSKQRAG